MDQHEKRQLQPWLHDLEIAVDGPATTVADRSGDMGLSVPGTGVFVDDRRVVSTLALRLDGQTPTPVASHSMGAVSRHWAAARELGDDMPDPTVEVHRTRAVTDRTVTETLRVTSRADNPVGTELTLDLAGDGADLPVVKTGGSTGPPLPVDDPAHPGWADERHRVDVRSDPPPHRADVRQQGGVRLCWDLDLRHGESFAVSVVVDARPTSPTAFDPGPGSDLVDWDADAIADRTRDPVLREVLRTGLTDLRHLTMTDPQDEADIFAAAGTPWYLTLFGRDAIWAARLMLPLSPRLAIGTLRALARRLAKETDVDTAAEPGKCLHEARRVTFESGDLLLPELYYGTVDATPLWIVLLHETWRAGIPESAVRDLLPALRRALGWMSGAVDAADDGLLRYVDASGHGLSNQGWKDSHDSMRRADGTIAPAPIALLEAQAYAVQAARGASELFEGLGERPDRDWGDWADQLSARVRERFWVERHAGERYLAMALDAEGRQVDGVGSNMGHALGTGLLTPEEADTVVDRMLRPDLLRRFGIGSLSSDNPAYNPVGYHTGSVWVHDTAIAMLGMMREGRTDAAREVARSLLALGAASGYRLPELCGGEAVGSAAVPYPASCRPQAWAAASAAALLTVLGT